MSLGPLFDVAANPAPAMLKVCPNRPHGSIVAVDVDEAGWEEEARRFVTRERIAAHAYRIESDGAWTLVHTMRADGSVAR